MKLPARYREIVVDANVAAKREVREIKRTDEAKKLKNKATAMEIYAVKAKDVTLAARATATRRYAVRRIGQLMDDDRKADKLAKPPGGSKSRPRKDDRVGEKPDHPTLADQGIDKNLAHEARKEAAMAEDQFEASVARAIRRTVAAIDGDKAVIKEARAERHKTKRAKRQVRERALAAKIRALPQKKYGVILADPEWRFEFWTDDGKTNSSADNHYPTSALDDIKKRDVPSISADDCVLFLWATAPMAPHALEVMKAWGFTYKSQAVWIKNKGGTGYWFRNKHEIFMVGTKGKPPAPADGDQFVSAIEAAVGEHSAKPEAFYEVIEKYFPHVPKIELNARAARAGWDAWGLEAPAAEAAE